MRLQPLRNSLRGLVQSFPNSCLICTVREFPLQQELAKALRAHRPDQPMLRTARLPILKPATEEQEPVLPNMLILSKLNEFVPQSSHGCAEQAPSLGGCEPARALWA
jgi:hypothetical protein